MPIALKQTMPYLWLDLCFDNNRAWYLACYLHRKDSCLFFGMWIAMDETVPAIGLGIARERIMPGPRLPLAYM